MESWNNVKEPEPNIPVFSVCRQAGVPLPSRERIKVRGV